MLTSNSPSGSSDGTTTNPRPHPTPCSRHEPLGDGVGDQVETEDVGNTQRGQRWLDLLLPLLNLPSKVDGYLVPAWTLQELLWASVSQSSRRRQLRWLHCVLWALWTWSAERLCTRTRVDGAKPGSMPLLVRFGCIYRVLVPALESSRGRLPSPGCQSSSLGRYCSPFRARSPQPQPLLCQSCHGWLLFLMVGHFSSRPVPASEITACQASSSGDGLTHTNAKARRWFGF